MCIALHQAGIEETVAVMGTAITPDQLKLLSQYAGEVVLALDADRAGREAMLRAQRVAGSGKLRLLVVAMPEGEDPAEMLALEGGEDRFRRLLAEAVDLPVFHVRAILGDADLETPAGRDRALDEVAPVLKAMGDTIIRQELISEVADRLETDPAMVGRRLAAAQMPKRDEPAPRPQPVGAPQPSEPGDAGPPADEGEDMGPVADSELSAPRPRTRTGTVEERREDAMLAMCIVRPDLGAEYISRLTEAHLVAPGSRRALEWLRANLKDPLKDLPRDDDELFTEVSRLKLIAEQQAAEEKTMELSWLMLERGRIDREITELRRGVEAEPGAGEATEAEPANVIPFERVVALQRERARIADAIAIPRRLSDSRRRCGRRGWTARACRKVSPAHAPHGKGGA